MSIEMEVKDIRRMKENATVVNYIMSTTNYDKFSFRKGNRNLNQKNFLKLINSMKEKQLMIPILVNEKFEIIDGQHRYSAAKELGLPVYYYIIEGYGSEEMQRANLVSSNWTKDDFLSMFVEEGNEDYEKIKDMKDTFNVNIGLIIKVFATFQGVNQKTIAKSFEEGNLDIKDYDKVLEFFYALEDFSFFAPYKTLQFAGAFLKLYTQPGYDHEIMKKRLDKRKDQLVKKNTVDDYLVILTKEIYSFGPIKNKLLYDKENRTFY